MEHSRNMSAGGRVYYLYGEGLLYGEGERRAAQRGSHHIANTESTSNPLKANYTWRATSGGAAASGQRGRSPVNRGA